MIDLEFGIWRTALDRMTHFFEQVILKNPETINLYLDEFGAWGNGNDISEKDFRELINTLDNLSDHLEDQIDLYRRDMEYMLRLSEIAGSEPRMKGGK
jgi:hypothetical protein